MWVHLSGCILFPDVWKFTIFVIRDLMRSKLANLFKTEFRGEILGKNLTYDQRSKQRDTGLLGGIKYLIWVLFFLYFSF